MKTGVFRTAVLVLLTTLAGCATIEGAGRDISAGASTVQGWFN
jgi:predicted small secreted protein